MISATKQYFYSGECSVTKGNFTFQEVHDEFRPKILRYLTRMVGEHEAEDGDTDEMVDDRIFHDTDSCFKTCPAQQK